MKGLTLEGVVGDTVEAVRRNQDDFIARMADHVLRGLVYRICRYITEGAGDAPERNSTNIIVVTSFIETVMKEYGGGLQLHQQGYLAEVCEDLGLNFREIAQRLKS